MRKSSALEYMKQALELALRAKGRTSPNPLVGALVVKNGRIIARGWHRRCGGDHAEIEALKKAGSAAQGASLYVTLEPCAHYGRTPPCVDAVIKSGIKKIFIGMKDPNPLTNGKSIAKLKKAGIEVYADFLVEDLRRINRPFIKFITKKIPFVTAKVAQTIDGKIAAANGDSKWITNEPSRAYAHRLRDEFDAILVGINTVLKDNPGLSASRKSKQIKKIVLDSSLRIPLKAKLFRGTSPADIFIATTTKANKTKLKLFQKKGINVIVCPARRNFIDLFWLLRRLAEKEITSILIEGGGEVVGSALKAGLVDKLLIFIAPKILGDKNAVNAVSGLNRISIKDALQLKDVKVTGIAEDILVEAYVYGNY